MRKYTAIVRSLKIKIWKYLPGFGDPATHIGPMAEDWRRQTGMGNGEVIHTVDAIGILLKCVQELSDDIEDLKAEILELKKCKLAA